MTENIELSTLRIHTPSDDDTVEEYDEIRQEAANVSTPSPKKPSDYDFFTKSEVLLSKEGHKKKKAKKIRQRRTENLMDIINSELAAKEAPIEENVITLVDHSLEPSVTYLEKPKIMDFLQKRPQWRSDAERGLIKKSYPCNLDPTFPRVLENININQVNIPLAYVAPTDFEDMVSELSNKPKEQAKFLGIELNNLKFKDHHQFTLENLLSEKLVNIYNDYNNLRNNLNTLSKDIKVNREAKTNLKQELSRISPKKEGLRFDPIIRKYTSQMLDLKEKYLATLKREKDLVNQIVSLWSDLEMVREKKGKKFTPVHLDVSKNIINEEVFEKQWALRFDEEFSDVIDKVEYDYVTKYLEYKERKGDDFQKNITKPKLQIDEEFLKAETEKVVNELVKKETIDLRLNMNKKIDVGKPANELDYHFKIYVDDVFVCESEHYMNNKKFNIVFTEEFSVQILLKNSFIVAVLYENGEETCHLKLKISEIKKNMVDTEFKNFELVYNDIIEPTSKYIGSGYSIKEIAAANKVRLKSSNLFKNNLYTSCSMDLRIGWNESLNPNNDETIKTYVEVDKKLRRLLNGIEKPTIDSLKEIIEKIYDQSIGNNDEIINSVARICKDTNIEHDYTFKIDDQSPEFVRIKLLSLRNMGEFSNVDNKRVPLYASQISTEQLHCLQTYKENEINVHKFTSDKYTDMDPIEMQRFIGTKYIENLNKNLLKNLNETLLKKTYKDVVYEFKDLSWRSLFTNQTMASSASLPNGARRQNLQDLSTREHTLCITVLRAFNLPDRTPSILAEEGQEDMGDNIAGYKVRSLRPFVKVDYQGVSMQTVTAIGCHPTWNQTLKIRTKPGKVSSVHINIYDEVKTNIAENYDDDQSFTNRSMHYRCYNKWLGFLEVPLYSVLALGKINGTFKLNMPSLILGYETHSGDKEANRSLIPEVSQMLRKEISFISLKITTNQSHLGGIHRYDLPTTNNGQDDYIIKHLNNFITEYQIDFPTRNISLTFIDSNGKNKCVTQFLQPIPLPDYGYFPRNPKRVESAVSKSSLSKSSSSKSTENVEKDSVYSSHENWSKGDHLGKAMNAAMRYVSLIPSYEVVESHVVTLMGVDLLRILQGSPLDHTILLASYFLHLGLRTYIAIGLGLPRGKSSYVLTKYDLKSRRMALLGDQEYGRGFLSRNDGCMWYVYDGISGERFELRDVSCPLKTVEYVFGNENIWVNMQSSQECENVSFDFTTSSDWQPVFDKNIFIMKCPLISDSKLYTEPSDVEQLRNMLEARLRGKVQKWRSHMKTIWNRYCGSLLRDMLPQWEYCALNPMEPKPGLGQRLKQLMVTYKIYGFPINLPYTNTKTILSAIKSTAIYVNDDPNVEFGLAVEVYAYPNNVLSVWVFLASVTRI